MYYEVQISRNGLDDCSKEKKFNEKYLIDALSITEAITRFEERISEYYPDHETKSVKRTAYTEVITEDGEDERYFHTVFNIITVDENTGKEKKSAVAMLIQASTFDLAKLKYEKMMRDCVVDIELVKLVETKILEYFPAKLA